MKNIFIIIVIIIAIFSCQNKKNGEPKNIIKTIVQDTLSKTMGGTANLSEVTSKEDKTAIEMIRKQLTEVLLKNDLAAMTKENRFFYYDAFDLNNDGKNEYFVGFSNSYFCGSGGCSGYILNNDGTLINSFTVTDFPIYVGENSSENFKDLIVKSNRKLHNIKMKNGKYPSNPSVQEVWKGEFSTDAPALLNISEDKYEKYSF